MTFFRNHHYLGGLTSPYTGTETMNEYQRASSMVEKEMHGSAIAVTGPMVNLLGATLEGISPQHLLRASDAARDA